MQIKYKFTYILCNFDFELFQMFVMIISKDSCKDSQFADELALAYISNSSIYPVSLEKFRDISPLLEGGMYVTLEIFILSPKNSDSVIVEY